MENTFLKAAHEKYVIGLRDDEQQAPKLGHWMSSHLRVSGVYWGLSALELCKTAQKRDEVDQIIKFTLACQNADGGFGGNVGHDSHLLYTLSAVQVLCILGADSDERLDKAKCAAWVAGLQQPDGSFCGDRWGEVDTRFSYSALNCLTLLGRLNIDGNNSDDNALIDLDAAVAHVLRCQNWDGGFGVSPSAESHAGQIFCCVGALSIAGRLGNTKKKNALTADGIDRVAWWLAERQLPSGGLNGRPEKKADVCYSWWVLSSLAMLGRLHWIDRDALVRFILLCQDADDGGIADKPGNQPDVYHTFFGTCGLSLLGWTGAGAEDLGEIDPTFAMPPGVLARLGIAKRGLPSSAASASASASAS